MKSPNDSGFIALVLVLTSGAVALIVGATILLHSITESRMSLDEDFAAQAWATASACGEIGLMKLSMSSTTAGYGQDWDYSGDPNVTIDGKSCSITIDGTGTGSSTPRTLQVESVVSDFYHRLSIIASTNTPSVEIDSWEQVADF